MEVTLGRKALTPRELEIPGDIANGLQHKEIAFKSNVTEQTIKSQMTSILLKLATKRTHAVVLAVKAGSVAVPETSGHDKEE